MCIRDSRKAPLVACRLRREGAARASLAQGLDRRFALVEGALGHPVADSVALAALALGSLASFPCALSATAARLV
eukprot:6896546-Alexandrium_andersonii.AAC.1